MPVVRITEIVILLRFTTTALFQCFNCFKCGKRGRQGCEKLGHVEILKFKSTIYGWVHYQFTMSMSLPLGLHLLRCMENDVEGEEEDQSALATEKREATDLSHGGEEGGKGNGMRRRD